MIEARISYYPVLCFFFFQAEDGIRDYKVTGVQTCALPIFACCPPGPEERLTRSSTSDSGSRTPRATGIGSSTNPNGSLHRGGKGARQSTGGGDRKSVV